MEEKIICTHCNQPVDCGYELVNGQIVCSDCVSHYCCVCDRCGATIWDTDAYGDEYTNLCRSCYENFYVRCERCECLIHTDDAYEYDGYEPSPKAILDKAKKGNYGRYVAVNLCNYHTVEFRLFRGTLKFNTLIAALQLVNEICSAALFMSDDRIQALSWSEFVSGITETELIQYLKERNLYVNEKINTEEEL